MWLVGFGLVFSAALVLAVAVLCLRHLDSDLEANRLETYPGSGLFAHRVRSRAAPRPAKASVILLHGWRCNSSQLLPLARHLARDGFTAYSVDSPGHGGATFLCPRYWLSGGDHFVPCQPEVKRSVEELIRREGLDRRRVVLVGWSQGAAYTVSIVQADPAYLGAVLLGPGHQSWTGVFPANRIKRMLALTGSLESPAAARSVLQMVTGQENARPGWLYQTPARGGAALWRIIPGATHTNIITHPTTLSTISGWLRLSLGGDKLHLATTHTPGPRPWIVGALALLFGTLLFTGGGMLLGAHIPRVPARFSGQSWVDLLLMLGCVGLGIFINTLNPAVTLPALVVRTHTADRIVNLIWLVGMFSLGALLLWRRHTFRRGPALNPRSLALGSGAAALILFLCANLLFDPTLFHLSLSPPKVLRALVIFFLCFPCFYLVEGALESLRSGASWRWPLVLVLELILRGLLCGTLFVGLLMVGSFPYMMLGALVGLQVIAALTNRAWGNWQLTAAFCTTLLSWGLAASLVAWSWG